MNVLIALLWLFPLINTQTAEQYQKLWYDNYNITRKYQRPVTNEEFAGSQTTRCQDTGTYDFIIVGAGSAGTVLARRLSEIADWKILLLEAGGPERLFTQIPAAFIMATLAPENWGYLTTPQKNCCFGSVNNQCDFPRGKVLGGSSSINAMVNVRGNREDFDMWAEAGNDGWSYEECLPYFKKEETVNFPADVSYHGYNGPLNISMQKPGVRYMDYIIDGMKELGYKELDYNGKQEIGVSKLQVNAKNGMRWSTNQGYLQPVLSKNNLKVITNALVTKIIIKFNLIAKGVTYIKDKNCFNANAKREVIISAGSINTPQLLLLSGIGPKDELRKFNIRQRAELPVGKNLVDHTTLFNVMFNTNLTNNVPSIDKAAEQLTKGEGPLSYTSVQGISVMQVRPNSDQPDYPDVEVLYSGNFGYLGADIQTKFNNWKNDTILYYGRSTTSNIYFTFMLYHPKSRGTVGLKSKDPVDFPNINPNYLSHPDDIEIMYEAIMENLKIVDTQAGKSINLTLVPYKHPDCANLQDKEYWYCVIRHLSKGTFHPMGTCRMGTNRKNSVVDNKLYVHGYKHLRIIDASVIPYPNSGHLNAVVVMIAEKMSDLIKRHHGITI